jgi:hypothetical protein
MDSTALAISVAVISGPLGVFIGYTLNERSTRERDQRVAGERNRSVRILLHREIEENLAALRSYLDTARTGRDGIGLKGLPGEQALQLRRLLIDQPLQLSKVCWESLLSSAPQALTSPQVQQTFQFYAELAAIPLKRDKLASLLDALLNQRYDEWAAQSNATQQPLHQTPFLGAPGTQVPASLGSAIDQFVGRDTGEWTRYRRAVEELIARGNPIPPEQSNETSSVAIFERLMHPRLPN